MSKPNYPLAVLVFILTLVIFTILGLALSRNNQNLPPTNQLPTDNSPTPTAIEANFNESGNLIKENDSWNFLYEEPGQPALKVSLNFTGESRCDISGSVVECDDVNIETGARAMVKGDKIGNIVTVYNLISF
ncbi:MAG: hypothetical protein ACOX6N_00330 [Patescibacteria group bacterium]|jgi:hypothetical protein